MQFHTIVIGRIIMFRRQNREENPVIGIKKSETTLRRPFEIFSLVVVFAIFCSLRAIVLFSYPYPPSGDVAGDLYAADYWLGHSIAGLSQSPLPPPLYFFVIVIPFTHVFGIFLGTRLYMSVVPALLIFPGYLIAYRISSNKLFGLGGAALIGGAASFSLMVTWNAAYNLFGIFFMMFFIYYLQRSYESPQLKNLVLSGLFFSLVVGSHALTALVSFIMFVLSGVLLIAFKFFKRRGIKKSVVSLLFIFFFMFLFSIPYVSIYYQLYTVSIFSGVAFPSQLSYNFANFLNFPWGLQNLSLTPIFVIDVLMSIFATVEILLLKAELKSPLLGLLLSVIMLPFIETSNAVRFLYFATIFFVTGSVLVFKRLELLVKSVMQHLRESSKPIKATNKRAIVVVLLVIFILLNTSFSYSMMQQSSEFNRSLDQNRVAMLNWIGSNTSQNSSFYDTIGLQTWMWGYAHRMDYYPNNLLIQVTNQSYSQSLESNLIYLGNYVAGNGGYALAFNLNSPIGDPVVYMAGLGSYTEFTISNSNAVILNTSIENQTFSLPLNYASLLTVRNGTDSTGSWFNFSMEWPVQKIYANVNASIMSDSYSIGFFSNNSIINYVTYDFSVLPNGYGIAYGDVKDYNGSKLKDEFSSNLGRFSFSISAPVINQTTESNGWTLIHLRFSRNETFTFNNLTSASGSINFQSNAAYLLKNLNISYVITSLGNYPEIERFSTNSLTMAGINFVEKKQFGQDYIYEVSYLDNTN